MKEYLIVSFFISLAIVAQGQNYCENCVGDNFTYVCNGKNCEGFWFRTNNAHPIITGIQCKQKDPCYVQDHYDNATNTYYYVACNFTMVGCGTCYEKSDCTVCYPGFHQYNYDV